MNGFRGGVQHQNQHQAGARGQELTDFPALNGDPETASPGARKLEMDKLFEQEQEREARRKAATAISSAPPPQPLASDPIDQSRRHSVAEQELLASGPTPSAPAPAPAEEDAVAPSAPEATSSDAPGAKRNEKWGHEAFEAVQAVNAARGRGGQMGIRGRGRGRGGFAGQLQAFRSGRTRTDKSRSRILPASF